MKIVDHHKQWRLLGRDCEEGESPGCDQVTIVVARALPPADRGLQRSTLGAGKPVHVVTHRTEELEQAGMVEQRLGLHAPGAQDLEIRGCALGGLQERRLPDTGLADDHEGSGSTSPSGVKYPFDPLELLTPADHGWRGCRDLGGLPEAVDTARLSR